MHFLIVTELGIVISENNAVSKSFPFDNPAVEFVEAKKGNLKNNSVIDYLRGINAGFFVSDDALLKMLKKESLDVQIMEEKQLEKIQEDIRNKSGSALEFNALDQNALNTPVFKDPFAAFNELSVNELDVEYLGNALDNFMLATFVVGYNNQNQVYDEPS